MDKSEKINKIKTLQKSISEDIKEKRFADGLNKINEVLEIAPNLQKIVELKSKIEKKLAAKEKNSPSELLPDNIKKETAPEIKPEEKTDQIISSIETVQANAEQQKQKDIDPVINKESQQNKLFNKEKEERVLNALLKEQEEEKEKEVDAILADFEDDEPDNTDEHSENSTREDEQLTADAVEAKLNALMQKEREKAQKGSTQDDIFPHFESPSKKSIPITEETKTKRPTPEEMGDFDGADESQIEALLNEPDDEPQSETTPLPKEKPLPKTEIIIKNPLPTDNIEKDKGDSDIENIIKVSNETVAETEKKEKKNLETSPKPLEIKIAEESGIPEIIEDTPKTPKQKIKKQENALVKNKNDLKKEDTIEFNIPPKISDEGISDKNISRNVGIPTIVSKSKKETKTYDFSISDETGIGSKSQTQPIYPHTQPHSPETAPDIDSTMGQMKKEGFSLKNIPQAIGFVFNMERLLISTIGITIALLVYLLFQKILPIGLGSVIGSVVYITLVTTLSTFICFTIIKQINEQIHVKFIHYFSEFKKGMLVPSIMFWIFWLAIIIFLGSIVAMLTAIGKFGSFGSIIYSLLSPASFIFAIILFSLILASTLLSFILPAIIAIDRPGIFSMIKEVMYVLKNHLFTILGGFIFNVILNIFIMIVTMFVLIGTYMLIGMTLMAINPAYLMKLASKLPPIITGMVPELQQMAAGSAAMMEIGGFESFGLYIFIAFMAIGSVFLISIPFIFQNGAAVITFLTIKGKKDILKKDA